MFDGEIDTPEQQAKVPKEVWQKIEPMVDKMGAAKETVRDVESPSDR